MKNKIPAKVMKAMGSPRVLKAEMSPMAKTARVNRNLAGSPVVPRNIVSAKDMATTTSSLRINDVKSSTKFSSSPSKTNIKVFKPNFE